MSTTTRSSRLDIYHDRIKRGLDAHESQRSIARQLGVGKSTLSDYIRSRGLDVPKVDRFGRTGAAIPDGDVTEAELLQAELADLRSRVRRTRKVDVATERVLEEIRGAVTPFDRTLEAPEIAVGEGKTHVQALLLSDLHGGEVVSLEGTDGMNEYNWEILEERMEAILRSLISFQNARPYPITELQVWMLGDMCSGSNHDELIETNEYTAAEQGWKMGELLASFVERLVEHYPRIVVYAVAGNHPRLKQKPASKNVFDNFDWLAYKAAELALKNYDTIEWHIPYGGFVVADIAGRKVLLFHGDGITSSTPGVPWMALSRRWNSLKGEYAERGVLLDECALGHFHQACVVPGVFMNGSVKGKDEYSKKRFGSGQEPTQLLLTFLPEKRCLTDVSYITPRTSGRCR